MPVRAPTPVYCLFSWVELFFTSRAMLAALSRGILQRSSKVEKSWTGWRCHKGIQEMRYVVQLVFGSTPVNEPSLPKFQVLGLRDFKES